MASLSNPTLSIKLIAGTQNAEIIASVGLGLSTVDKNMIQLLGVRFRVGCSLRGSDSGFNGGDDTLFAFTRQTKSEAGIVVFKATISRDILDEDWEGNDEIYARFSLSTNSPSFPANVSPKDSAVITGNF